MSQVDTPLKLDDLLDLLRRQRAVYEHIQANQARQPRVNTEGEAEQLLSLLHDRRKLVDRAQALHAELEPFRQQWDSFCAGLSPDQRATLDALLQDVAAMQRAVIEQDAVTVQSLERQRDQLGAEQRQAQGASRAVAAYRSPAGTTHRYTDQRG